MSDRPDVGLRPIQPIDGCSCSVCQKPEAIEVLVFRSNNYTTDVRLCASCKKLTINALVGEKDARVRRSR